jgi:hypothetical protein
MTVLGDIVEPYGEVVAMGRRDGERWYMLSDEHGTVTLMPGDLLDEDDGSPRR